MTFDQISTELQDRLGITAAGDITRLNRAINRVYKNVTSTLGIKHTSRRTTVFGTVSIGVSTLAFTSSEKIVEVFNRAVSPYRQLDEVSMDELRQMQPYADGDLPTHYAIKSIASDIVTIEFNSIPATAFDLYADVYATTATLATTDEPAFSESYHDILIHGVLVDEYLKIDKLTLSTLSEKRYDKRMGELQLWIAVSTSKDIYQSKTRPSLFGTGGAGSGSGGGGSQQNFTQVGLITFDRSSVGAGLPPFAVDSDSMAKVTNLDADLLDGHDSTYFAVAGTPGAHKTQHENGGSDEISVSGLSGVLADPQPPIIGATSTTAVAGDDTRLTNARTPTAHAASHENGGADEISVAGLSGLLADAQTPAAHTHPTSAITGIADDSLVGRQVGEADAGVSFALGFGLEINAGPTLQVKESDLHMVVGGGLTGQFLTKQSADDYDYDWADAVVANGGTGRASHTEYAVICGGTTDTGAQQSIAGVGTAAQVLTSNGAGLLPTFQDATGGGGAALPVGFIFMTVDSTNPNTLLGYGTWVAFGAGRMPIGLDSGNAAFDTVEETGGAQTVTLDTTMIPSHTHTQDAHTHTQNAHTHTQDSHFHTPIFQESGSGSGTDIGAGAHFSGGSAANIPGKVAVNQNTTAVNQNAGGGLAHSNMPPYIVVYMFERTA